jgi:hypothetical protein
MKDIDAPRCTCCTCPVHGEKRQDLIEQLLANALLSASQSATWAAHQLRRLEADNCNGVLAERDAERQPH